MTLSDTDKQTIARARELATLHGAEAIRQHTGQDDTAAAYAAALGEAQHLLYELASLAEKLAAECGKHNATITAFDEVAGICAAFDWERDDRQYALERIEMIVLTGHEPCE